MHKAAVAAKKEYWTEYRRANEQAKQEEAKKKAQAAAEAAAKRTTTVQWGDGGSEFQYTGPDLDAMWISFDEDSMAITQSQGPGSSQGVSASSQGEGGSQGENSQDQTQQNQLPEPPEQEDLGWHWRASES